MTRLRGAGAELLGKLNFSEPATAGYNPAMDVPRNPWNTDYWPGLSSSGSGVALAVGLCYAAIGTDTGGSIRYPAAANGVVGLSEARLCRIAAAYEQATGWHDRHPRPAG